MNTKIIFYAVIILIVIFLLYLYGFDSNSAKEETAHVDDIESFEIAPSIVAEKIKNNEDIILLDVRTLEEYDEIHLENALLLPVQELSQDSLDEIGLGEDAKNKEIIIYCRSGARSKIVYDIMDSLGYANIKSVAGGMIHWQEDNYPFTETGAYTGTTINSDLNTGTSEDGPKISIDRTFHDFGVVPQYGGAVTEAFTVRNDGTEVLEIGSITTSCSCTSASISSASIDPRGDAQLTIVFDPDFHDEPLDVFKRTVFIPTNDPLAPEAEVVIQVDIDEGK
jgi:phage shock protein E